MTSVEEQVGGAGDQRILLVEDNEANRYVAVEFLAMLTALEVDCAADGLEAVELFDANPAYRIIIMDQQMPKMDGLEATRLIREKGYTGPIIATTANVFEEDRDACLAAGMNDFIAKPIRMDEFKELLDRWLQQ